MRTSYFHRSIFLLVSLVILVPSGASAQTYQPAAAQADRAGEGSLRFAIALVQGLKAYAEPKVVQQGASWAFPILHPMRILDSVCVGRDLTQVMPTRTEADGIVEERCPNPTQYSLWYKLERDLNKNGWAMADHVAVWNSRHALRPATDGSQDLVAGYCDEKQAEAASKGRSEPCMNFNRKILAAQGERVPFPVLDTKEFGDDIEFDKRRYFKVLVPTLYSEMALVSKKATKSAMVAEFLILLDSTSSMDEEIQGAKDALREFIANVEDKYDVDARFAIIGYRDTDGSSSACPAMEGTLDEDGKFGFVTSAQALKFLGNLKAKCGGDPREAIWDAMYLLRDLKVTPGSNRMLLLIGDTPGVEVTRGLTFGGVTVPKGLSSVKVLSSISDTLGESSRFMALLVKSGMMRKTVDQILKGSRFINSEISRVDHVTAQAVQSRVASFLASKTKSTAGDVKAVADCNKKLQTDENGSYGFFCGDAASSVSQRIRDLIQVSGRDPKEGVVVIREVWVPATQALQNVALLTNSEAKSMGQKLGELAQQIGEDGSGCKRLGPSIWIETVKALIPVDASGDASQGAAATVRGAVVGKRLHDYWRLSVGRDDSGSIINLSPDAISALDSDRCFIVRNRLHQASQAIERVIQLSRKNQYIWLSFKNIP